MSDPNDVFNSERTLSCKFPKIGTKYAGKVLEVSSYQQTDLEGEPVNWPNGKPKMGVAVTLDAGATGDWDKTRMEWVNIPDDNGQRTLFCEGGKFTAVKAALKAAGVKMVVGGHLSIELISTEAPSNPKHNPRKIFTAKYTAGPPEDPFAI